MTEILISLAGAAITGLTFVAYRHPDEYHRLARIVSWALIAVILLMSSFATGVRVGKYMIIESVRAGRDKVNAAAAIFDQNATAILFTLVAIAIYSDALRKLPKLLKIGKYKDIIKEERD